MLLNQAVKMFNILPSHIKELRHSVFVKRVQGWLKSDLLNSLKEFYEVARDGGGGGLTLHRQVLNISFTYF